MPDPTSTLTAALAGRYRIERELGAGGMATVYLAHDEKHDRKVAIKVLKPELAAVLGAERFVVEIKTTASLQHPHILPLFDSGTAGGFLFYVMPFIEGETIREKLNRETQFGVDEAVRIAREVADALDYAHRHGVIHRDIKPENILLHDGRAMVMDFGIALAVSAAAGGRMTETGLSLGTPHYMSPEQATAEKEITPRSDVYSLASVLYEMLAGQPPHIGGAAQQVIMKIITEPAQPVRELRKNVPPNVEAALARALEKLPADRFESAKAFADALANATYAVGPSPAATAGVRRDRWMLIGAVGVAAAGLIGGWALGRGNARTPSASREANVSIILPDSTPLDPTYVNPEGMPTLAIAHDGSAIVFVGRKGKSTQLYVRRLSSFDVRALDGTDGAFAPFFSPNGDEVAFFAGARLMRVSLTDGHTTQIADGIYEPYGGTWTRDGRFVISTSRAYEITVLGANGDSLQTVTCGGYCSMPELLPDGRHVLTSGSNGGIGVVDLQDRSVRPLRKWKGTNQNDVLHGSMARYDGDGHLVWVSLGGDILAAPFDAGRVEVNGPSIVVAQGARVETGRGAAQFALGADGTIVFAPGPLMAVGILVMADRTGRLDTLKTPPANYSRLELSPDGQRVLARILTADGLTSAAEVEVATGKLTPWATSAERIEDLAWDIDGHHAWYRIGRTAYRGDPRLTTKPESLSIPTGQGFLPMPDGQRFILYVGDTMLVQRLDGKLPGMSTAIRSAAFGPVTDDSRWVVQQEVVGRNAGLVARALDSSARRLVISNNPDFSMAWTTPGAGEILVGVNGLSNETSQKKIADEQSFWSIPYTPASAAPFGQPRLLFRASVADFPGRNYGVGLKGQRFVFKQHVASQPPREIRLVQNWHAALAARGKTAAK